MSHFGSIQPEDWPDQDEIAFAMEYAAEQAAAREAEAFAALMRANPIPAPEPKVVDLMAALEASLAAVRTGRS